mmetsp:Transcript_8469/g.12954  ORF Transcript_8469/g.12954 Transcript_8469/m.12954 type:complete len:250 (+) Transcript_8469:1027-1776(+)
MSRQERRSSSAEVDPLRNGTIFRIGKETLNVQRSEVKSRVTPAEHERIAREFKLLLATTLAPTGHGKRQRRENHEENHEEQSPIKRGSKSTPPRTPPTKIKKTTAKQKSPSQQDNKEHESNTPTTMTRSGRRSFPALNWWTSQRIAYDAEGSATALVQGSSHDTIGAANKESPASSGKRKLRKSSDTQKTKYQGTSSSSRRPPQRQSPTTSKRSRANTATSLVLNKITTTSSSSSSSDDDDESDMDDDI